MENNIEKTIKSITSYHNRFIIKGETIPDSIPGFNQEILDSWRRSKSLNLPYDEVRNADIPKKDFREILEKNKDFIEASVPYLTVLFNSMKNTNSLIQLCDSHCNILKTFYEKDDAIDPFMDNISRNREGYRVTEEAIGTNSTALSIKLNQPLRVLASEHYRVCNHPFACSSSPIHAKNGDILGCITIMTPSENYQVHTLTAAIAASDMIEKEMEAKENYANITELNLLLKSSIDVFSSGMLILDRDFTVVQHNKSALDILKLSAYKSNINGTSFLSYLKGESKGSIQKLLSNEVSEEEIKLETANGRTLLLSMSTNHLKNSMNKIEFYILYFTTLASQYASANKITGATAEYTFDDIIGPSTILGYAKTQAIGAAKSDSNVLLSGESGTGKELFAQSIHNASSRANGPFIAINCGALPKSLIESELFGYEKGAFSGANRNGNPGKFELADRGTIFLDEIGEMPLELQATLLRVLQTKYVTRIGGSQGKKVDIKIIAATNVDLLDAIRHNKFRADLYYRLNVLNIQMPPLRARKDDILPLSEHFLAYYSASMQKNVTSIDPEALNIMYEYDWPGNVRELENTIERAVNLANTNAITLEDLPGNIIISKMIPQNGYSSTAMPENISYSYLGDGASYMMNAPYNVPNYSQAMPAHNYSSNGSYNTSYYISRPGFQENQFKNLPEKDSVFQSPEYKEILSKIEFFRGNVKEAADSLSLPVSTLYSKLKKYGINPKNYK